MSIFFRHVWSTVLVMVVAVVSAGCASMQRMDPPNLAQAETAMVPGFTGIRSWGDYNPANPIAEFDRLFPGIPRAADTTSRPDGRPIVRVLALSGGGPDGAFGAGLLNGWTASGRRPQFHVVTGISAGALIAPFAYLGPAYDQKMREVWTEYETNELVTAQLLPGLLGGASLADTSKLAAVIAKYVDRAMLRRVASEYAKGRILLIGTTNLDVQRPVVWNMGAIAKHGTPEAIELFRNILLASAAIPGAFPPVQIRVAAEGQHYDEMHVDGGTTREVFVGPVVTTLKKLESMYSKPPVWEFYLVKNGKLGTSYKHVKPTTISISLRAIETLLNRQNSADIYRIFRAAKDGGADFNLMAVPETFNVIPKQAFDPDYQAALYQTGFDLARSGIIWMKVPPELLPTSSPSRSPFIKDGAARKPAAIRAAAE